jgi:phage shock protein PspC (stress-responsive transcriptional regulator)
MEDRTDRKRRGPRGLRNPDAWHRDYDDRRIAGVCASLAQNLEFSVSAVRLAFIVLFFIHGTGLVLYAALWALLPERDGEPALLDRWIRGAKRFLGEHVREAREHPEMDPDFGSDR